MCLGLSETIKTCADTVFISINDSVGQPDNVRFLLSGDGSGDSVRHFRLPQAAGYCTMVEVNAQIHRRAGNDPIAAAKSRYANLAPSLKQADIQR